MRILLVDDDPEIRLLAGHLLRGAGHEVIDAADAESRVARWLPVVPMYCSWM
jgi:CheY-like chemotaxis protein